MKLLHLHIDRIVVEGLPEAGQRQFASALRAQLREFAESGIANQFSGRVRRKIASLNAGQLRAGTTPSQAAMQVVQALRQNIGAKGSSNRFGGVKNSRGGEAHKHA
jgi:hypothetical protein